MFSHPAAILGLTVMGIGWLVLINGGSTGGIVNMHTLWIANGLITTGAAFLIGGVAAGAANVLRRTLLFDPAIRAGETQAALDEKARKKAERDYIFGGKKPEKQESAGS